MHEPIRCEAWCAQYPNCQHDWSSWRPVTAPVEPVQVSRGPDGQWSITGLSEDDLWTLASSLGYAATNCFNDTTNLERLAWVIETGLSY